MNEQLDISVILCTYNRCDLLLRALESILAQKIDQVRYEVIVVDNNSTDNTRGVVESFIAKGHTNLRYLFEGKQGLAHARNAGIMVANAPIVALTDDDLCVASDWVAQIKYAFDKHPEVVLVGSRVLPRWNTEPPSWLTKDHWSPLALFDQQDSFYSDAQRPHCLLGISLRREVFEHVGFFAPELQRVKDGIGSSEDHELQLRLWRGGYRSMYVPEITVIADVQLERMNKSYHRRWHSGHGKSMAIMGLHEATYEDGRIVEKISNLVTLFGIPTSVFRDLITSAAQWMAAMARRQKAESFVHENKIRYYGNYIRKCAQQNAKIRKHSSLAEISAFIKAMARKKAVFFNKKL
jgi:glycosyltransferase involved in cell wall biosynthesis